MYPAGHMIAMADDGEFMGMWMAHETDEPQRDAFPNGWGDLGEDALGEALDALDIQIPYTVICFSRCALCM